MRSVKQQKEKQLHFLFGTALILENFRCMLDYIKQIQLYFLPLISNDNRAIYWMKHPIFTDSYTPAREY